MSGLSNSSRLSTGSPSFNEMLLGGLTRSPFYQIEGDTGTGKTPLATPFIVEGKQEDECRFDVTLY